MAKELPFEIIGELRDVVRSAGRSRRIDLCELFAQGNQPILLIDFQSLENHTD